MTYMSHDFYVVCIWKQISVMDIKMGRRRKELCNDFKEIAKKKSEAGKTIDFMRCIYQDLLLGA